MSVLGLAVLLGKLHIPGLRCFTASQSMLEWQELRNQNFETFNQAWRQQRSRRRRKKIGILILFLSELFLVFRCAGAHRHRPTPSYWRIIIQPESPPNKPELRLINYSNWTNFLFSPVSVCILLWINEALHILLKLLAKYFQVLTVVVQCCCFSDCIPPTSPLQYVRWWYYYSHTGLVHSRVLTESWWTCVWARWRAAAAYDDKLEISLTAHSQPSDLKLLPNYIFLFKVTCETSFK